MSEYRTVKRKGIAAVRAAFILMSAVMVIYLFAKTSQVMNSFAGSQDSAPETEIDMLYNDIKEVCENPTTSESGTADISSSSSISESLTVCDSTEFLCYNERRYGDGDLANSCSEGIEITCDGNDYITGEKSYKIRVIRSTAIIECEEN